MIIPFFIPHAGCAHQCVFCNQRNITGRDSPPPPATVAQTIRKHLGTASSSVRTEVAFYGGSFTALPPEQQQSYLGAVRPFIETGEVSSIRISTRPDSISSDRLDLLEQFGVGTVELGAQSMNDRVLSFSGRGHSAGDTERSVRLLRDRRFTIGIQLMPGLPGDSPQFFRDTVVRVIDLGPDMVRLYPALVLRDTPLELQYRDGRYTPLSLDEAVTWCRDAMDRLERSGIRVIRVGLQPTEELDRPGTVVAGPYHPSFRQLVDSARLLDRIRAILGPEHCAKDVTLAVNPRDLSSAAGQKRHNVRLLKEEFGLRSVAFGADASVPRGEVRLLRA